MVTPKGMSVEVKKMTAKDLATLRSIMPPGGAFFCESREGNFAVPSCQTCLRHNAATP